MIVKATPQTIVPVSESSGFFILPSGRKPDGDGSDYRPCFPAAVGISSTLATRAVWCVGPSGNVLGRTGLVHDSEA
jgi:hypothetical protein